MRMVAGFAGPDGTEVLERIGASFGSAIRSQALHTHTQTHTHTHTYDMYIYI